MYLYVLRVAGPEVTDYPQRKVRYAMASGGEPERSSSRKTDEQRIYQRSVIGLGKPKATDRRCYKYKQVSVLKTLWDARTGVCEIKVETKVDNKEKKILGQRGTCFLAEFAINYQPVFGLFTANHVLNEAVIHSPGVYTVTIDNQELGHSHELSMQNSPFHFTCPLLDVTFIEFNEELKRNLIEDGFNFLHVYTQWQGEVGEEFHVLHYPGDENDHSQYYSAGHLEKYHGLHIFHSASTEEGSSGAPVAVMSGNQLHVVAIHTAQSADAEMNYNVAVNAKSFFEILFDARRDPNFVSHHPTEEELLGLKERLENLGLEMRPSPANEEHPPRIPFYFTHLNLSVRNVEAKVLIHFVLTSHGWYWSDVAPHNGAEEPNWVPATMEMFGCGSHYRGKKVVVETAVEGRKGFSFAELRQIRLVHGSIDSGIQRLLICESNIPKEMKTEPNIVKN